MKITNLIIIIAVIIVNALANILPINDVSTGDVSQTYDNLFTPAGFTFAIWSLIYLSLIGFGIFQFISKSYSTEKIGYWLVVNGLANICWIFSWHYYQIGLTVFLMVIILFSLVKINLAIRSQNVFVRFTFGIYLGWICVATVANTAVYLKFVQWNPIVFEETTWAIIVMMVAGGLGLLLIFRARFPFSALIIPWGAFGIYSKLVAENSPDSLIYVTQAVIAIIMVGLIFKESRRIISN